VVHLQAECAETYGGMAGYLLGEHASACILGIWRAVFAVCTLHAWLIGTLAGVGSSGRMRLPSI
jgi:hypothetical protein